MKEGRGVREGGKERTEMEKECAMEKGSKRWKSRVSIYECSLFRVVVVTLFLRTLGMGEATAWQDGLSENMIRLIALCMSLEFNELYFTCSYFEGHLLPCICSSKPKKGGRSKATSISSSGSM